MNEKQSNTKPTPKNEVLDGAKPTTIYESKQSSGDDAIESQLSAMSSIEDSIPEEVEPRSVPSGATMDDTQAALGIKSPEQRFRESYFRSIIENAPSLSTPSLARNKLIELNLDISQELIERLISPLSKYSSLVSRGQINKKGMPEFSKVDRIALGKVEEEIMTILGNNDQWSDEKRSQIGRISQEFGLE